MKKTLLLHTALSELIASLGHGDMVVIADAGLSIPPETRRIDLALCRDMPPFLDTVRTVLSEMQVERAIIAEETGRHSPHIRAALTQMLPAIPLEEAGIAVQLGTYPGLLAGIATGLAIGALNGALIVWGRLPPFVATLASMATARGLTLVYTQGRPIAGLDQAFTFWGSESRLGVPMPVWILLITAVIAHLILRQTRLGLHLYAIGGGEETARLAGVNVGRIKFSAYLISGLCAALSGIILTARLWSAQPNTGIGLELDAIAAAVLGGSSLAGGAGGIPGTVAGSFIIGMLANGLNLLGVPSYHQQVMKGAIFVIAVVLTGGVGIGNKKQA